MGRRPDPQAQEFARILDEYRSTRTQLIRPPETDRDKREKGEHQLRVVQSLLLVLLVCLLAVALGMATHVSHDSSHFGSRTPSDTTLRCISLQDFRNLYRLSVDRGEAGKAGDDSMGAAATGPEYMKRWRSPEDSTVTPPFDGLSVPARRLMQLSKHC